ncbi:MAG: hypothetical protein ACI4RN_02990 [Oscillospiraceae bacterium]
MNIEEILKLMDELLDDAGSIPFSSKKSIDCEQMREYVDSIRLNLPAEMQKAKDTARDRENIINEANKEAENIIKAAEEKAKVLVSQEEILKQADDVANDQIQRAMAQANKIVAEAIEKDKTIRGALADKLDKTLSDAQRVLARNLTEITDTRNAILGIGEADGVTENK